MKYTENYRLPLWEESDRVLRADFNDLSRNVEAGLAENVRGAREGDLEQRRLLEETEDWTFELFCRAAYNHYCQVRELETMPRQIGVFHQSFAKSMSGTTGIRQKNGYGWMTTGERAFTSDELKRSMKQVSSMTVVRDSPADCVPLVLTFHTTAPGELRQIGFPGDVKNGDGTPQFWRFSLYNATTGAREVQQDVKIGSYTSSVGTYTVDINIHFWGGYDYRLEVSPLAANYNGRFQFDLERSPVSALCFMHAEGSAVHTFTESEASSGGLAVIRYNIKRDTGEIWLEWDGKRVEPDRIRDITENGIAMKEAEFRRKEPIPAESTLTLQARCQINGEIYLYGWGAVLL